MGVYSFLLLFFPHEKERQKGGGKQQDRQLQEGKEPGLTKGLGNTESSVISKRATEKETGGRHCAIVGGGG